MLSTAGRHTLWRNSAKLVSRSFRGTSQLSSSGTTCSNDEQVMYIKQNPDDESHICAIFPQLTKIVGTIGPVSEQYDTLSKLVKHGLRIMRLNFSHATKEEVELRVENLRNCRGRNYREEEGVRDNFRAVLLDTRGPEIRTGKLAGDTSGKKKIQLKKKSLVHLHTDEDWRESGSETDLFIDYPHLARDIEVGKTVLLDDGAVILTVVNIGEDNVVQCVIDNDGSIRSRAGGKLLANLLIFFTDLIYLSVF